MREEDGTVFDVSVIGADADGTVRVRDDGTDGEGGVSGDGGRVAVNRAFLLDALDAGARDRLVLELGAPTAPVAVRRPDDEDTFSLLMPVRLDG